ncbi:MAG: N-acetyltransferase [candidate division KSB1 bacterium]|nr:N-acetyltransferase [candidate division KSB1 bacterium]
MSIQIKPVSGQHLKTFVKLPWTLYQDDPCWVPPLISDQLNYLNPKKGPFYEFGDAELFLACKDDVPVGRISAQIDRQYESHQDAETGFFGFFESINDIEVAEQLLHTAETWVRDHGKSRICGPFNFTLYDASGLLVKGFDTLPVLLTNYNKSYYAGLLEQCGYRKHIDWYAFRVSSDLHIRPVFYRIRERIRRQGIVIKSIDMKKLDEAVDYIGPIFNEAWAGNHGHVPLTDRQLEEFKAELKYAIEPDLTYLAFLDGQCIGFSLSVKDANPAIQKANGRLFPFGLFKIMHGMRHVKRLRTFAMGVLKEHRNRGLDIVFYLDTIENGIKMGYTESECSVIVETNNRMIGALEDLNAEQYKTFRFYENSL